MPTPTATEMGSREDRKSMVIDFIYGCLDGGGKEERGCWLVAARGARGSESERARLMRGEDVLRERPNAHIQ